MFRLSFRVVPIRVVVKLRSLFGSLIEYGTYYLGYPKVDPNFDNYPFTRLTYASSRGVSLHPQPGKLKAGKVFRSGRMLPPEPAFLQCTAVQKVPGSPCKAKLCDNIGALIITTTILGVPYFRYSIMGPKKPYSIH